MDGSCDLSGMLAARIVIVRSRGGMLSIVVEGTEGGVPALAVRTSYPLKRREDAAQVLARRRHQTLTTLWSLV